MKVPQPYLAPALKQLRDQVNARWPTRSKASDGWIGDTAHGARKSDHNPNAKGCVTAIDITHDPRNGFDSYRFADLMLKDQDPRLEYIISKGRIGSGPRGPEPGKWRKYTGANPHDHHVHFSVDDKDDYPDQAQPWDLDAVPNLPNPAAPQALPTLRRGAKSKEVGRLQRALKIDDDWDFGRKTEKAVMDFQREKGLDPDGICGPQTWKALGITRL